MSDGRIEESKDEIRLKVMRILEVDPSISQRDLAKRIGISLGSVNYCVKALAGKGYVKFSRFKKAKSKSGYAYLLTPAGAREKAKITVRFLSRKKREYEALVAEIDTLEEELRRENPVLK